MAAGTSRSGRWVTRVVLVCLFVAAVAAAVAGITYAVGTWGPLSDEVQTQVRQAVLGYELAAEITRPPALIGKKLTKSDKAALQARYLRRLARYATDPAVDAARDYDYAALLRGSEHGGRELVGVTGRIVYWDGARKVVGGDVHVRAGVGTRFKVIRWDDKTRRAVPQEDWMPEVTVYDFTLRQVDGAWKVADARHWRFYDPATGRLSTGP